jgi:peptidoglycan/xylan/chitin deacetylase (PgdA/CDA1 family)
VLVGLGLVVALAAQVTLAPSRAPEAGLPSRADKLSSSADTPPPSQSAAPLPTVAPTRSPSPVAPSFPPLAAGILPILYLHRVEAVPAVWATWTAAQQRRFLAYDVLPNAFAAQLDWLRANGYTTILPRDLAAHWDHGAPLPPRPVIISLDDGWPSWTRTVLPMLQARGMVAEFYLTLDAIASGTISWSEVRQLAAARMGIGAHDVHHVQLAELGSGRPPASAAEMWYEVDRARLIIDRETGRPPDSMAYVGGGYNAELEALVRLAGYTTARSIERGVTQSSIDRFALRVVALRPCDDVLDVVTGALAPGLPVFAAKLSGSSTSSSPCPTAGAPLPGDIREQ